MFFSSSFFFDSENKATGSFQSASGVQMKVGRGSIESVCWFNRECIRVHYQRNPDALSI